MRFVWKQFLILILLPTRYIPNSGTGTAPPDRRLLIILIPHKAVPQAAGNRPKCRGQAGKLMGIVYAKLALRNMEDVTLAKRGYLEPEKIRKVELTAIVDNGV